MTVPYPITHAFKLKIRQPSSYIKYANFSDKVSFPITLVGPETEQNKGVHFPDSTMKNITLSPHTPSDQIGNTGNAIDVPLEIAGNNDITRNKRFATVSLKARSPVTTDA